LLTPRERLVLALLVHGESNAGIARHPGPAVKTVEMNLTRVYRKLGVCSRTQAALCAQERRLLEAVALPAPQIPRQRR
jgi:DNA-binding NarL/FixJ family response regulator